MKINRRYFIRAGAMAAAGLTVLPSALRSVKSFQSGNPIRLGGPVEGKFTDPAEWSRAVKSLGYSAAYSPVQPGADPELIKAYRAGLAGAI